MPPAVHYADSDGVSIAFQELGAGPAELVWVPGFVAHSEVCWEEPAVARFLERLASFSRLVLWDKREQGLSDRTGRPPTLEQAMDDLRAVLDAAGVERATLFGVSEGGPMALLFAATYPERVERLVLCGSYARMLDAPDHPEGIPRPVVESFIDRVAAEWGTPAALDLFAPSVAEDARVRAWWARFLRCASSPSGARALLRMYFGIDVRPVLPAVRVPTLVVHRASDRISPVAQGRHLAAHIPGARLVELPGADHLPMFGGAEAILDEVEEFVTGVAPGSAADRVLATVLFTDIVASTDRAVALGDRRWRDLLAAHDALVRRELERHRGRLVKATGDGALAVFDGPARAIRAAQRITAAAPELGLEVRAGLHTGECELIGGDVGGIAVHIAARVAGSAEPGEVRVSRTVADLVAGSGMAFGDRGEHELKGVPDRWRLFAVAPLAVAA